MRHPLEAGTLRICKPDGSTVGTGFLVTNQLAVTCAHVIEKVGEIIQVQFTGQKEILSAQIKPEYHRDSSNGDIVFLQLENFPESISPLPLGAAEHSLPGNSLHAFGYPFVGTINGVHARGEILGLVRDKENEQRLLHVRSQEIEEGFSGSPVWDEKRSVVVGMVVSVYKSRTGERLRDTAFAIPSETLWSICPEIQASDVCPYLGLDFFTEETERFFFGREVLTHKLLHVMRGGNRFLAVFGPSGSGKSSLIRAGLLPALKQDQLPGSQRWAQILMRPADDPYKQIATLGLNKIDFNGYIKAHPEFERVVLVIDQFEELFTLCADTLRDSFIHDLAYALEDSKISLIICVRDDFYSTFNAKAAPLAQSEHLKIENVPANLGQEELVNMIKRPAEVVGLKLEDGLTEITVKDLTQDGNADSSALPLLEFALMQLWKKRRDGRLTHDAYQTIGGVTGSLARWADEAYSNLSSTQKELSQSFLTSLVHIGDDSQGVPDTRQRNPLNNYDEATQNVIQYFTDRRLIVTNNGYVEIIHDALVREWEQLKEWVRKDRNNLRFRDELIQDARRWDEAKQDKFLLVHRNWRLDRAQVVSMNQHYQLDSVTQAYLNECVRLRDMETRVEGSRRRAFVKVLIAASLIAVALAGFAVYQMLRAQEQTNVALAGKLAAESLVELGRQRETALLLSVQANRIQEMWNTRNSLFIVVQSTSMAPNGQPLAGHTGAVNSVTFSPDGKLLASGSEDFTIRLWDAVSGQPVGSPLVGHTASVSEVAFSPDSRLLASSSKDGTIRLWDVVSGMLIGAPLSGHTDEVTSVAFSPDGRTLVSASRDHTVRLWDVTSGRLLMTLSGHTGYVSSVVFSPDGTLLASAGQDDTSYTIRLWEADSGRPHGQPLIGHTYWITALAFSHDGKILASSSQDKTIRLWDVASGKALDRTLWGHTDWVTDVSFSPDDKTLVSSSWDKSIRMWDANTGQQLGPALTGHTDWITSVAFSPDGKLIVSGSEDSFVRLWALGPAVWMELACKTAGRNFTRAEWELYLPDERYHATCPEWSLEP